MELGLHLHGESGSTYSTRVRLCLKSWVDIYQESSVMDVIIVWSESAWLPSLLSIHPLCDLR